MFLLAVLSALPLLTNAAGCIGSISSLNDVAEASKCSLIQLNGFTVPAGQTLKLNLNPGTVVTMNGDITFGNMSWPGPLVSITGTGVIIDGNGHTFNGGGPFYWDGRGASGGVIKPSPMFDLRMSGNVVDMKVVNSPERIFALSSTNNVVLKNLTVDNSLGDAPTNSSNGLPAAADTDAVVSTISNLLFQDSNIRTQGGCLVISNGNNIIASGNTCIKGKGFSIGPLQNNAVVSNVIVSDNNMVGSTTFLQITVGPHVQNAAVSNIIAVDNTATALTEFGVLIDQSFPRTLGEPGNGARISAVSLSSDLAVNPDAKQIAVNCGVGSCQGVWNWDKLRIRGGRPGPINNFTGITGFSQ